MVTAARTPARRAAPARKEDAMTCNDRRFFHLVSLAALLAFCAGCAGNPSTLTVPNAMAPGSFPAGASAFAQPAAAPPADRAAAEAVGAAIPALRGIPP